MQRWGLTLMQRRAFITSDLTPWWSFNFPSSVKSEQLVQVSHSSGAVWSLPRAAAAASSLGATLSSPLCGGRSPGRGGERGGSLHIFVNIIYLLTIAPYPQVGRRRSSLPSSCPSSLPGLGHRGSLARGLRPSRSGSINSKSWCWWWGVLICW